ncbi:MAG: hypothetical protein ABW128_06440 [Rhizorhabdus sp.]
MTHIAVHERRSLAPVIPALGGALPAITGIWVMLLGASVLQDLMVPSSDKVWLLDVDAERSIYTWFSQLLLAGAAVLMFDTAGRLRPSERKLAFHWFVLSGLFLILSMDEGLALHERVSGLVRSAVATGGYFYFAWVLPAAAFCAVGLLMARPFILSFRGRSRLLLIVSAAIFLAGAIGMEMVGSKIFYEAESQGGLAYRLSVNLEEGLEGLGLLILIYALTLYRQASSSHGDRV